MTLVTTFTIEIQRCFKFVIGILEMFVVGSVGIGGTKRNERCEIRRPRRGGGRGRRRNKEEEEEEMEKGVYSHCFQE